LNQSDKVLQKTPISFDVSVWELFWPLLTGAQLVIARPGGRRDSAYLIKLIADQQITTVHFVPSMLQVFLEEDGKEHCRGLRRVVCSGEALSADLQRRFFEGMRADLYNLYGPTEAAIDVTSWKCDREGDDLRVPIGRPIANTQMYVLDGRLEPVPVGVAGELYIGGRGLARGYFNRPELTAERFIPAPFSEDGGARVYRTGDLAQFRVDGSIDFLGRIDHQVKIRGFRIELEEIEAVLREHNSVDNAVVVARKGVSGDQQLIAYLVCHSVAATASELRNHLSEKLPEYMVPHRFVRLDSLPLTPSGKVDRRALPPPDEPEPDRPYTEPRTAVEKELAAIWRGLLAVERIGVYDNFFDMGGHSLLLTQLASRIHKEFNVRLPLRTLFDAPTIVEMTGAIALAQLENEDVRDAEQVINELKRLSSEQVKALLEAEEMA
jgi:acyl-coenzyme A synthetase/AMP-(fatty) acid ligase